MKFTKRVVRFLMSAALLVMMGLGTGCMSGITRLSHTAIGGEPLGVYPGVRTDLKGLLSAPWLVPVWGIDLPFSFGYDTCMLPHDLKQ